MNNLKVLIFVLSMIVGQMSNDVLASSSIQYPKIQIMEYCADLEKISGLNKSIEDLLIQNTKKLCHDTTGKLVKKIRKYLKKQGIPIVDQDGELVLTVEINKTQQFTAIDSLTIERVIVRGQIMDKEIFNIDYDQSNIQNKKNEKQIAKKLATNIVKEVSEYNFITR